MKSVILAGGSGTRLFPLSRKDYPKQFLKLFGDKTMIQHTMERALSFSGCGNVYVVCGERYSELVNEQLSSYKDCYKLIIEPAARNTAPAIALAMKYILDVENSTPDAIVGVFPSDHYIHPVEKFKEYVEKAEKLACEDYVVTFGIVPKGPETGYGYIEADEEKEIKKGAFKVRKFHEKPSYEVAQKYVMEGNYFWNSGMFVFKLSVMTEEIKRLEDSIGSSLNKNFEEFLKDFHSFKNISIDYAVMEKTSRAAVVVVYDVVWSDVGSWNSVYELKSKDTNKNVVEGPAVLHDASGSLVINRSDKKVYLVGVEDVVVIQTDEAVLIVDRKQSQKVREVAE